MLLQDLARLGVLLNGSCYLFQFHKDIFARLGRAVLLVATGRSLLFLALAIVVPMAGGTSGRVVGRGLVSTSKWIEVDSWSRAAVVRSRRVLAVFLFVVGTIVQCLIIDMVRNIVHVDPRLQIVIFGVHELSNDKLKENRGSCTSDITTLNVVNAVIVIAGVVGGLSQSVDYPQPWSVGAKLTAHEYFCLA